MRELANLHFLRPGLLYWLVPCALYALFLFTRRAASSPWAPAISAHLLPHLLLRRGRHRWFGPETLLLASALLAVLAAAGPSFVARTDSNDPKDSALVVVFELSDTMNRRDVSPSRAERARLTLLDLLERRPESPTALVVVAGSAHVLMPFTDDEKALEPSVQALSPALMPFDGQAFELAARRVAELVKSSRTPPAVLLVSDGITPAGSAAFARLCDEQRLGLVILAVGEDDDSLARLSADSGAELVNLSFGARDTSRLLAALAQTRAAKLDASDARVWRDDGRWLALPLALLIALWFRRGWVLSRAGPALLWCVSSGCSPELAGFWLTPDQQGRLFFQRGDYVEAARRFDDARWKGLSYYAAEQWDAAAHSFVQVESADGLFLLGNAYAQGGKLESALEAYDRALQRTPTDRKLRKNRDRIWQLTRSLQEDTEPESEAKQETDHGDRAISLDKAQLKKPPADQPQASALAEAQGQSVIEERVWLSRLTTDPSEFLKRKLALEAARGDAR